MDESFITQIMQKMLISSRIYSFSPQLFALPHITVILIRYSLFNDFVQIQHISAKFHKKFIQEAKGEWYIFRQKGAENIYRSHTLKLSQKDPSLTKLKVVEWNDGRN